MEKVDKAWGYELIIHNDEKYCGKILHFNKWAKFSMHYHLLKQESWYFAKGRFIYSYIDTTTAIRHDQIVTSPATITLYPGQPHQLEALEEGEIFEVSTQHFDSDSYRIAPGDSQKQ